MRHYVRRLIPNHDAIRGNRWFAPFQTTLLHPRLWHLNRRSAAGGVAVGLFCGLVPGPLQMLSAAILAIAFRINLPLALLLTLYTNPLTIVPLYLLAFQIGTAIVGGDARYQEPLPLAFDLSIDWLRQMVDWMLALGLPLAVGLVVLASGLALTGYLVVRIAWRLYLVRAWSRRKLAPAAD